MMKSDGEYLLPKCVVQVLAFWAAAILAFHCSISLADKSPPDEVPLPSLVPLVVLISISTSSFGSPLAAAVSGVAAGSLALRPPSPMDVSARPVFSMPKLLRAPADI